MKNAPYFFKIIYWVSLSFICYWIVAAIIGQSFHLEFTRNYLQDIYDSIFFFGLPLAILIVTYGTLKILDKSSSTGINIVLSILVFIITFFIMFFSSLSGMCSWTTDKILFEQKQNKSIKIVTRDYDCGATDSGTPVYKVFKVTEIAKYLIWVSDLDTSKIDKNEWIRIEE